LLAIRRKNKHMHATLIVVDVTGVGREEGIAGLRNHLVPAIKAMPGFVSGTWLTGGTDGHGLSLTVWATETDAQAFADRFRVGASPQDGAAVVRSEVREVAATA
jgi:heme-degrading monooxygenase HmoA